jgi:hypothetical protein
MASGGEGRKIGSSFPINQRFFYPFSLSELPEPVPVLERKKMWRITVNSKPKKVREIIWGEEVKKLPFRYPNGLVDKLQ